MAVPYIVYLLSLHENFQHHNTEQVNCYALWLNRRAGVYLNNNNKIIKIVAVMNMNNLTHTHPC